ncbi:MAG: PQQ-dependent sugar dehydrogenase, partial [Actinobacteria bacterium]|nr:PQQ-dependent sugar dehydrogenase [Actinomycetota bacterium]
DHCVDPAASYERVIVPTGLAFAPGDAQAAVAGHLFVGAYGTPEIRELTLDRSRENVVSDEVYVSEDSPVVAVTWGPEGLYYSTTTAVKLIPLAQRGDAPGAERRTPSPTPTPGEGEGSGSTVGFALVIVVLLGLYAASRRRLTR